MWAGKNMGVSGMTESPQKRDSILLFTVVFILIVSTVTVLAVFFTKDSIQNDLQRQLAIKMGQTTASFSLDGRDVQLIGTIASEDKRQDLLHGLKDIDGIRMIEDRLQIETITEQNDTTKAEEKKADIIKPKALAGFFSIQHDAGKWFLQGDIDTAETQKSLITSMQEVFGNEQVIDELNVVTTTQPDWVTYLVSSLEQFGLIQGAAELTLNNGLLTVSGDVISQAEKRMILTELRSSFGEFNQIKDELRILNFQNGVYQPAKAHLLEQIDLTTLSFEKTADNQLNLQANAETVLQTVLDELKTHDQTVIEIGGHTSASDNGMIDQKISLAKALIVKNWLVTNGINEDRIKTIGYGTQRPIISSNGDTDAGLESNDRMEIRVIKGG
jgi:outer membrane protein OmpA-like peptidoglycan-associated protein/osmotically-inducible protein OsmY